ncbi:MAG: aminotransferase class V-fold PLP-dependent enzyme, partial [Proteobacteria bacterium]|nr:aminotransferase class V-fold PLP-dependent enzyme [Pseudomonadota bacterium]
HIAGVIGLGSAIDYVSKVDLNEAAEYENQLLQYANEQAAKIPGLTPVGTAKNKTSIFSFTLDGIHPHDIGTILDDEGIAIRAGHHCAMPVMERFKIPATARASFAFYNTREDVDALIQGIDKCKQVFN